MRFEFATAGRIIFGPGVLGEAGRLIRALVGPAEANGGRARRALLVTGQEGRRAQPLGRALEAEGFECVQFAVSGEPTTESIRAGLAQAAQADCGVVLGMGGGSALDAGKAIAALATNPGDLFDYLEVVGGGKALERPSLPYVAIPSTAGTGSEVTRNAVVMSPEHNVKVSLRSPYMLPALALVDPELTWSLPPAVTAATGLDALTQLIEPFVSHRANPMTDALCREGMARAARSLRRAFEQGDDAAAREDMSIASLFGGLALANAGLGAVHGFAGPIGGMFAAPHGALCAALLPHVMRVNVRALQAREPASAALERYRQVAAIVTGQADATIADGVHWVSRLVTDLGIPGLGRYGIQAGHVEDIVAKSRVASSMKANPIELTSQELNEIVTAAI